MDRNYKIKVIFHFFNIKYNEEISTKVLSIINNYSLDYTVNNNGIFINISVLNDTILDMIYSIITEYQSKIYPDLQSLPSGTAHHGL